MPLLDELAEILLHFLPLTANRCVAKRMHEILTAPTVQRIAKDHCQNLIRRRLRARAFQQVEFPARQS